MIDWCGVEDSVMRMHPVAVIEELMRGEEARPVTLLHGTALHLLSCFCLCLLLTYCRHIILSRTH